MAENQRLRECAAQQKKEQYEALPAEDRNRRESFAYAWIKDGQVVTHPIRPGTEATVRREDRAKARNDYGIDRRDIVGFTHNHPSGVYCRQGGLHGQEERRFNAYPSDNDWAQADLDVLEFGAPSDQFTLFIIDCDGDLRAFPYSKQTEFHAARERGDRAPQPITPECETE